VNQMKKTDYKLTEYRIYQDEGPLFWWETHCGFGVQQVGMCFIYHDLLILGPCSREEVGYLKREFLDRQEELEPWNKTKYYCFASELLDVVSGRSLDHNFVDWVYSPLGTSSDDAQPAMEGDPDNYRLDKYQITVAPNGEITWQMIGRMDRLLSGQCLIQSEVLFLGAEDQERKGWNAKEYSEKLDALARWNRTRIWSRSFALRPCHRLPQDLKPPASSRKIVRTEESGRADDKRRPFYKEQLRSRIRRLWPRLFKASKFSWSDSGSHLASRFRKQSCRLFRQGKFWLIWLIFFVVAGLFVGLTLGLHSAKENLHRTHFFGKHHHK
jgi:hypothetical protein